MARNIIRIIHKYIVIVSECVGLFTRATRHSRFVRRDVCLRWTLGCHAPNRALKKNEKPTPPASYTSTTPTSSTTIVSPRIYSCGSSIFYSKYRPTPAPPRLSPHEQSPASTRSLHSLRKTHTQRHSLVSKPSLTLQAIPTLPHHGHLHSFIDITRLQARRSRQRQCHQAVHPKSTTLAKPDRTN